MPFLGKKILFSPFCILGCMSAQLISYSLFLYALQQVRLRMDFLVVTTVDHVFAICVGMTTSSIHLEDMWQSDNAEEPLGVSVPEHCHSISGTLYTRILLTGSSGIIGIKAAYLKYYKLLLPNCPIYVIFYVTRITVHSDI